MNKYVIDAYAWVEYFDGTVMGKKVKEVIEHTQNDVYTNIITIAEVSSHFSKKKYDFAEAKRIIVATSSIFGMDITFAEGVGKLHAEIKSIRKHISLADIFVLATAKELQAHVLTGDEDFRGLKEVIMLK